MDFEDDKDPASAELRAIIARLREIDRASLRLTGELRDLYAQAKDRGFTVRAIKRAARKKVDDSDDRAIEREYLRGIGLPDHQIGIVDRLSFTEIVRGTDKYPSEYEQSFATWDMESSIRDENI